MSSSPAFVDRVADTIRRVLTRAEDDLAHIAREASDLSTVAESLLVGGKRFRAKLSYWGWRAAATRGDLTVDPNTENGIDRVVSLATGLELFHAAALVHDDIIDHSDTRRGVVAAHRQFESHHRERRMSGPQSHYGISSAILLGDLLLSWADDQFLGAAIGMDPESLERFRTELRTMRTDVTAGQFLDNHDTVAWRSIAPDDGVERAHRVVTYKSAKYSMEAPIVLGALLGGASERLVSGLREFALPLGIAFQLRDDMLGVFGDENVTGKPAGDDLREGKRTVLLALARNNSDRSTLAVLDELVGDPTLDEGQIEILRSTLIATGAVEHTERLIASSREQSLAALGQLGLDSTVEKELENLVEAITVRTV